MFRDISIPIEQPQLQPNPGLALGAQCEAAHGAWARGVQLPFVPVGRLSAPEELIAALQPYSGQAEALRDLQNELRDAFPSHTLERPIAVLSADRGDGKTYLAANLAVSLAERGRTLLIDGNMRTPRLHALFGVGSCAGLSDLLGGDADASVIHTIPDLPGLHFMAAGSSHGNPLELVHGARFGVFLQEVARKFDAVVIDTPADTQAPDARVIAARAGAALIVGRHGRSRVASLRALTHKLNRSRTTIAGLVLNAH